VSLNLKALSTYCNIQRGVMVAEREFVMIHQAMPTVAHLLTGRSTIGRLTERNERKKQTSGPPALLDVARRAETLSR
jgi:hypothetical protein